MSNQDLASLLERQKRAFLKQGIPSLETRISRIDRAIDLLVSNQDALCTAMSEDFGQRSRHQSLMADIYGAVESLRHAKKHVKKWMKDEKRAVQPPLNLFGAKAVVKYQPKGVVGAIATWNFPVWVPFSPLGGIFAAGNRCMLKLSELTPATSALLEALISQYFDEEELAAVNGGAEVGEAFSRLPFDHLIFTGSTHVGKRIMLAAAENLVPVTLELGGKSPVIVGKSADLKKTALALAIGKCLNVGQVCLSPDYIFVREDSINELIAELERAFKDLFPTYLDNPDYTSVINERHYQRLMSYLDEAKEKEAEIWEINHARENFHGQQDTHKIPPTLVINPDDELKIMQEEIFGPLIPMKTYKHIDDVFEYINDRSRPLALYYFGKDVKEQELVLNSTISGGVTINDVIQHVSCEDLPFGGIGDSGMGNYHGVEGFKTFSHARSVYTQAKINFMALAGLIPPYTDKASKMIDGMIKR